MKSCRLFKRLARKTWERIEFVRLRRGHRISETTITENLLFDLTRAKLADVLGQIARNERRDGNDFELRIQNRSGTFDRFMVQAKIIRANGRYGGFAGRHGLPQCQALINYARARNATPLYLFYNYGPLVPALTHYVGQGGTLTRASLPLYGCSIAHAYDVRRRLRVAPTLPSLTEMNYSYALPWHVLACGGGVEFDDGIRKIPQTLDELLRDEEWVDIYPRHFLPEARVLHQRVSVEAPTPIGGRRKEPKPIANEEPESEELPLKISIDHRDEKEPSPKNEKFLPRHRIIIGRNDLPLPLFR